MIVDEMRSLALENTLVTIERDNVSNDQITGVILQCNENFVLMRLYKDSGKFDCFSIFPTDQITEILWGNREHECISKLMKNETVPPDPIIELGTIDEILRQLAKNYPAVSLMENGNESSFDLAEIVNVDKKWIKLRCYGTTKTLSPLNKIISFDTFSRIEFDSPYANQIINLHNLLES